jgi:hypothetical protein
MDRCEVCGGSMRRGAIYSARDDDGRTIRQLPGQECVGCGCLHPDVARIEEMDPATVPSSVRIRCAKIRAIDGVRDVRFRRG